MRPLAGNEENSGQNAAGGEETFGPSGDERVVMDGGSALSTKRWRLSFMQAAAVKTQLARLSRSVSTVPLLYAKPSLDGIVSLPTVTLPILAGTNVLRAAFVSFPL